MATYRIKPYLVSEGIERPAGLKHWEYLIIRTDEEKVTFWDSSECDNGIVSQQPHSAEEALRLGQVTLSCDEDELKAICFREYEEEE